MEIDISRYSNADFAVLGDKSAVAHIKRLLCKNILPADENAVILTEYGKKLRATYMNNYYYIETPKMLPKTSLLIIPEEMQNYFAANSRCRRYLFVEEFPYGKQSTIDLINALEAQGKEISVVLSGSNMRQASTDLLSPGENIKLAEKDYRDKHIEVFVLNGAESAKDFLILLNRERPIFEKWTKKMRSDLQKLRESKEIEFDYKFLVEDWHDEGEILDALTLSRLFSFQTAKREKGDNLWDRFASAVKKALFPNAGLKPLMPAAELYMNWLKNPLIFWSEKEDAQCFSEEIKSEFQDKLEKIERKNNYRTRTQLPERLSESEYLEKAAKQKGKGAALNAVFEEILSDFLQNDVKNMLQSRINQRYKRLEEMIDEK